MADITADDLRAAVAAGTITEAQAANLLTTAQTRAGLRMVEDEPFELFKGFAEIFVAVGLCILIAGMAGLAALIDGFGVSVFLYAALAWWLARYFTLKRRMMLPSIVLVSAFAACIALAILWLMTFAFGDFRPETLQVTIVLAGTLRFSDYRASQMTNILLLT